MLAVTAQLAFSQPVQLAIDVRIQAFLGGRATIARVDQQQRDFLVDSCAQFHRDIVVDFCGQWEFLSLASTISA